MPVRCGHASTQRNDPNAILLCQDGAWVSALRCPAGETCFDDDARGAPACTDRNDAVPYGAVSQPCEVEDGQACSVDRTLLLVCTDGAWTSMSNCGAEIELCTLLREGDGDCTEPDGCVVCQ